MASKFTVPICLKPAENIRVWKLMPGKMSWARCGGGTHFSDQNSVTWPDLTARKTGKYNLTTCPGGKGKQLTEHLVSL